MPGAPLSLAPALRAAAWKASTVARSRPSVSQYVSPFLLLLIQLTLGAEGNVGGAVGRVVDADDPEVGGLVGVSWAQARDGWSELKSDAVA